MSGWSARGWTNGSGLGISLALALCRRLDSHALGVVPPMITVSLRLAGHLVPVPLGAADLALLPAKSRRCCAFHDARTRTSRLTRSPPITVQKITGIVRSVMAPHPASRVAAAPRTAAESTTAAVASRRVSWWTWGRCPSVAGQNAGLCQRQVGGMRGRRDRRCCARPHLSYSHKLNSWTES